MSSQFWLRAGSLLMLLGVAAGAFGAHGLKNFLSPEMKQVYETGVKYQIYHALALLLVSEIALRNQNPWVERAGFSFLTGIFLFSGSLYVLSLSGIKKWGMVTPLGGLAFLAGWAFLLISSFN